MVINAVELALPNNANKQTDQRQDSYGHRGTGDHRSDRACRDFARGSCNYNNCSFRHDKGDQDRQTGRDKDKRDTGRSRESNNSSNQNNQRQREDNNQRKGLPRHINSPCFLYMDGPCKFGERCSFTHDTPEKDRHKGEGKRLLAEKYRTDRNQSRRSGARRSSRSSPSNRR